VFSESFEEGSISGVTSRWSPGSSGSQNMTLSTDIPAGSSGTRSLRINSPSGTTGGGLYKNFAQDYDELYVRYYVKYLSGGSYHHAGGGLGGYNPMSDYLNPSAGIRPASERFSTAIEINANNRIDFYDYWVGMGCLSDGNCWGNSFINDSSIVFVRDRWTCVEERIKMNNPVTSTTGEQQLWIDGQQVSYLGPGFPTGTFVNGVFTPGTGPAWPGFQWSNTSALKLNWLWLQNYVTDGWGAALNYDDIVVSTQRVGCLGSATPPPPAYTSFYPAFSPYAAFSPYTAFSPSTSLPGDLNIDGSINALDLQLEVNVILGTETNTTTRARADLNADGAVNALDLQRLVNLVLGL
jgi:hypothetical protein